MDISLIDNLAYNTDSIMHRASALSKLLMVTFVIAAVIISADAMVLALGLIILVLTVLIANLPARVLILAGYAFFFSLIFAISQIGGGAITPLVIILKAVTAAMALIMLITTTPYPHIFALMQKVLPAMLVDAMLVTYRSFFILIEQIQSMLTALRMRAGYSPLGISKNLSATGRIIGYGFIHAWELSESMQDAMYVRGYKGRLPVGDSLSALSRYDAVPIAIGLLVLVPAVLR